MALHPILMQCTCTGRVAGAQAASGIGRAGVGASTATAPGWLSDIHAAEGQIGLGINWDRRVFNSKGGRVRYSPLARHSPQKRGSIDGPPKNPRLTPGPRR